MAQLRGGDAAAAERLFREFAHRLVGLARNRLAEVVRAKEDPEDVVQSVFRSFFARHQEGRFTFTGWNDLWNLLAMITLRKCGHRVEHYRAACRDVTREQPAPRKAAPPAADSLPSWEAIAREPTPSEAAILVETTKVLLATLSERDRIILERTLQGRQRPGNQRPDWLHRTHRGTRVGAPSQALGENEGRMNLFHPQWHNGTKQPHVVATVPSAA